MYTRRFLHGAQFDMHVSMHEIDLLATLLNYKTVITYDIQTDLLQIICIYVITGR